MVLNDFFLWEMFLSVRLPKRKRIRALRDVLERFDSLTKAQVDKLVAARLGVEEEVVSKNLYRDIDQLEEDYILQKNYFTRNGDPILDYDKEKHKNVQCRYQLLKQKALGKGAPFWIDKNIEIHCTDAIKPGFKVEGAVLEEFTDFKQIWIGYQSGSSCILVKKTLLPLTIIVCRKDTENFVEAFEKAEAFKRVSEEFGPMTALVSIKSKGLSRYIKDERFGHFRLTLFPDNTVEIEDFGSRKGVRSASVNWDEEKEFVDLGIAELKSEKTVSGSWPRLLKNVYQKRDVEIRNKKVKFDSDIIVRVSSNLLLFTYG